MYDVIVIGAGPSGVASAIYSARKGLKVGLFGKNIGGQVLETNAIENIIGTKKTTGFEFSKSLIAHLDDYEVDKITDEVIELKKEDDINIVKTKKEEYKTKTVIIATGAKWRKLNIEGEQEFTGNGVHYCSTCDGPFYRNLKVVIVGGGNSGVEAALDLANIAKSVTLIEFMPELKADKILQNKLRENEKINVIVNAKCSKITGKEFVTHLTYIDRGTNEEKTIETDGIFVEIGLNANTDFVKDYVKVNRINEIIIDEHNMTSVSGVFASGDCTNVEHKQIIIAMGEGAKAALSAFNYILKQ